VSLILVLAQIPFLNRLEKKEGKIKRKKYDFQLEHGLFIKPQYIKRIYSGVGLEAKQDDPF
jgi:hypothetical protein